jgi:hypothetical protein
MVSPVIGPEPSTQVAAGGENADGPVADLETGRPEPMLADRPEGAKPASTRATSLRA